MKYLRTAVVALCAALLATVLAAATAGAAIGPRGAASTPSGPSTPTTAAMTLVQGLPQTSVDVYLNATEVVQDFRFKGVVGPLPLLPGHYHIAVRLHGMSQSTPPLLKGNINLVAGDNVSIVADLDATGNPALTKYWNPQPSLAKGRGELVVRNAAEDPGLTVWAYGLRIFRDLKNPHGNRVVLPSEWIRLRMTQAGTHTTLIVPFKFFLRSQTVTIIYAVGSPTTSFATVEQTYSS
jgi:Domain of unknown function (DUF4397)